MVANGAVTVDMTQTSMRGLSSGSEERKGYLEVS